MDINVVSKALLFLVKPMSKNEKNIYIFLTMYIPILYKTFKNLLLINNAHPCPRKLLHALPSSSRQPYFAGPVDVAP
jgi:hypothetical protein